MNAKILLTKINPIEPDISLVYIIGAIIALLILGYLFYSLVKPEKF